MDSIGSQPKVEMKYNSHKCPSSNRIKVGVMQRSKGVDLPDLNVKHNPARITIQVHL